jgi:type IV pilus assembly protein PilM
MTMALPFLSFLRERAQRSRYLVGLDMGSSAVKMIAASGSDEHLKLEDCAIVNFTGRSSQQPVPAGKRSEALADIISREGLDLSDLRVSLSGKGVIVRHVDMPRMRLEELRLNIKYEAELLLPFSLDEAIYDCHILDPEAKGQAKMKVLLVAARRTVVNENLAILKDLGIIPRVVSVGSVALANAFEALHRDESADKSEAVINIGAARTLLSIISHGELELTREIEVGGDRATVSIARSIGIDFAEAEKKKCEGSAEMKELVAPMLRLLGREMRSTFDYVTSKSHRKISKIHLSGGGALCPGTCETLAAEFGVDVEVWNPLAVFNTEGAKGLHDVRGRETLFSIVTGLVVT